MVSLTAVSPGSAYTIVTAPGNIVSSRAANRRFIRSCAGVHRVALQCGRETPVHGEGMGASDPRGCTYCKNVEPSDFMLYESSGTTRAVTSEMAVPRKVVCVLYRAFGEPDQ